MEGSYKEEEERQGTEGSEGTSRRGQCQPEERVSHSGGCDGARNRGRAGVPRLSSSQSGQVVSASPGNVRISAPTPETSHWDGPSTLRSRVILQVSLNMLKPEKPCGEEEASELQGFIPAGRVPPLCLGTREVLWNVPPPPWPWDWLEEAASGHF